MLQKLFIYFYGLPFSSLVDLRFLFGLFIAQSTIPFMSSSSAETSNARPACGLASSRTWTKYSYDFKQFNFPLENLCSKS